MKFKISAQSSVISRCEEKCTELEKNISQMDIWQGPDMNNL